jgi:hypothetical protein
MASGSIHQVINYENLCLFVDRNIQWYLTLANLSEDTIT